MQAIILAAGMGKRLGEFTEKNTKCMVRVNGETLIERMLAQLDKHNLKKIVLVIGFEGKKLKEFVSTLKIKTPIEFFENPVYDKTNNIYSLYLAREILVNDDTILLESDLIFEDTALDILISSQHENAALVARHESWMDGTLVDIDENMRISNFISTESFPFSQFHNYFKTVNVYKFSKDFSKSTYVPFMEAYCQAFGHNEYYEQVLSILASINKTEFHAVPLNGIKWYEIDDVQDLEIAETIFATDETHISLFQKRYGGYWRFPGVLDYCYLVNPFFPPQRMREEMKSNFDTLLTEYPSGMEVNSRLMAKNYSLRHNYVCVGNGAAELIKSLVENQKGKIGISIPTFDEYANRAEREKLELFSPPNENFSYSAQDLKEHFEGKEISMLLVVNPDNPSGNLIGKEEMLELCKWAMEKSIRLLVDESFIDFSGETQTTSILSNGTLEAFPNLIVIKSISKSFGVPGIRLGFIASSDVDLVNLTRKDLTIWNINSFAENYMQIYSKYHGCYLKACKDFMAERETFFDELLQFDWIRVIPSKANYFLCQLASGFATKNFLKDLLLKHNIFIKDCSGKLGFKGKNYFRIAIRSRNDNQKFITALKMMEKERGI